TDDSTAPAARATSTDSVGSTHSDPRTYSLSTPRPAMPASAILILYRASDTPPASPRSVRLAQPLLRHGKVPGQQIRREGRDGAFCAANRPEPGDLCGADSLEGRGCRRNAPVPGRWATQRRNGRVYLLTDGLRRSSARNTCREGGGLSRC